PYRQMLIRLFNDLEHDGAAINIKNMLSKYFFYCLNNSADYLLAGYSFDLCVCDLTRVSTTKEALQELSRALTEGLADPTTGDPDPMAYNFIHLAHLKSQSYYQESYTDLFDFCFCLDQNCRQLTDAGGTLSDRMQAIQTASTAMMALLENEYESGGERFILHAGFAGPECQYSHGLSVYFPWTEPDSDNPLWSRETAVGRIVGQYEQYKFEETGWRTFLQTYFDQTRRDSRKTENRESALGRRPAEVQDAEAALLEDIASLVFNEEGQLSRNKATGEVLKLSPMDGIGSGDDCVCPTIKNYPRDTRDRRVKGKQAVDEEKKLIPLSPDLLSGAQ
ncbi:MAG: hypothetical protein JO360_12220, partial [Acidobacteria bacterium]|nr:hypothetical protein [Acidobacteriota bacterium]